MVDYFERDKKFTDAEFKALPRRANGRLEDLAEFFWLLTESQVNKLHSDDWSYYYDLQEEVAYLYNSNRIEIRNA
jgi:hypothetical protein